MKATFPKVCINCWYGETCEAIKAGRKEILGSVSGEGIGYVTTEDKKRWNKCPHGGLERDNCKLLKTSIRRLKGDTRRCSK